MLTPCMHVYSLASEMCTLTFLMHVYRLASELCNADSFFVCMCTVG